MQRPAFDAIGVTRSSLKETKEEAPEKSSHEKRVRQTTEPRPLSNRNSLNGRSKKLVVYTYVHGEAEAWKALKVGIREFREKLASYLVGSNVPAAIRWHGDTVGYYIPTRRKRAETERAALKEAASRLQQVLASEGVSEDEISGAG